MTTRAKRMKKALEAFGWETDDYSGTTPCASCHMSIDRIDKFCRHCGSKVKSKNVKKEDTTLWHLERSIAYALGEIKRVHEEAK